MNQNNKLANILKVLLPAIPIAVIVISFFNMSFYYSQFGVAIQNYVEVSEIIFSLLTFTSTIYLIGYLALAILIAYHKKEKQGPSDNEKILSLFEKYKSSNKKILRFLTLQINENILIILTLLASLGLLLLRLQYYSGTDAALEDSTSQFDLDCLIFIFVASWLLAVFSLRNRKIEELADQQICIFFLSMLVLSFTFLGYRNERKADLVKLLGKPKFSVTLKTDSDKIYKTSDSLILSVSSV